MAPCADFPVRKDLKRKDQQLETAQKMELGVAPTLSAQVIVTVLYHLVSNAFNWCSIKQLDYEPEFSTSR